MCKFHSVFLTDEGQVFTCGHGRGGRLGHGNEETLLVSCCNKINDNNITMIKILINPQTTKLFTVTN